MTLHRLPADDRTVGISVVDADIPAHGWVGLDLGQLGGWTAGAAPNVVALSTTVAPTADLRTRAQTRRIPDSDLVDIARRPPAAAAIAANAGAAPIALEAQEQGSTPEPPPGATLLAFERRPLRRKVLYAALSALMLMGAVYTAMRWSESRVVTVDDPASPVRMIT